MWATGATNMIARAAGSTLFANSNVASIFGFDHRSLSTANNQSANSSDKNNDDSDILKRMRDMRALTPYAYFVKDNYYEFSKKYPSLKMTEVSKKLSEMWKIMPENEKKTYAAKSEEQKLAYETEKKKLSSADLQRLNIDERTKKLESRVRKSLENLPLKRPRSAFARFLGTLERGEANIQDFMKGASKRWALLPVEEKQRYEQLYYDDKAQYSQALVSWALENEKKHQVLNKTSTEQVKQRSSSPKEEVEPRSTSPKKAASTPKAPSKKPSKAKTDSVDSSSSSSDRESSPKGKKSTK